MIVKFINRTVIMLCLLLSSMVANALDIEEIKKMSPDELAEKIIYHWGSGKENQQTIKLLLDELQSKASAGNVDAVIWKYVFVIDVCNMMLKHGLTDVDSKPACAEAFGAIKQLLENKNAITNWRAAGVMELMGDMYKKGIGTKKSTYNAADWYIKAAYQNHKNQYREGALRSMEQALELVPDHPAGLKLREVLVK